MSRISLVEAYDNRDVIGQLVRLREDVNELQNILKDIDPDGDLTNVVTKTGDQTIDGIKTFIGKIVADCDIIQLGGNYETHAEQVYSKNDYIVMRDEAVNALAPGTYSGLQIKKYNGSDDLRLAADQYGVARLGDIGDEKPLMVRDETGDMTSGNILTWDGVNQKAITSGKAVSDLVEGSGNIGDDTHPVKIVNGVATVVTDALQKAIVTTIDSVSNVNVAHGSSTLIANPAITAGTYIVTARFSSLDYGSASGFFISVNNVSYGTFPFLSGLTPIGSAACVVQSLSDGTIPFRVTQYSGATMRFSVDYTLTKIA